MNVCLTLGKVYTLHTPHIIYIKKRKERKVRNSLFILSLNLDHFAAGGGGHY